LERPAPIDSVGVEVSTTGPSRADLVVVSGLPNACYTFGHYRLTRDGDALQVEIVNLIPDDPMLACAEIYGMITTRIPVEGGVEACQFYQVEVNGTPYSVQAIAPNARCMGPSADPDPGTGPWPEDSVVLDFGRRTPVAGTDLALTLIGVSEDSRCPSDVVCIWAGRAVVVLLAELDGHGLWELRLSTDGGSTDGGTPEGDADVTPETAGGYTVELLQLEPYPVSPGQIPKGEYAARVLVTGTRN
jgi:hypothetical protein